MGNLFQELKRRNVFRVAIAYIAIAWLILQVADIVFENFGTPDWVMKTMMFVLAVGFPLAILFAWAYEMTPDGIKREQEVDRSVSVTHETGQKLNRTIIVVLAFAVAFLLIDKFWLQNKPAAAGSETDKSVAVLPFVAMSNGENDEYFADGLTEEILNSLTRLPDLLVTARTSAFHFKGQDIPIPEVAEKLGVAHVVEGSVRRDGDRLRVTAQLVRAEDGFHLWSENYDRDTSDAFVVQTDIAEKIAGALNVVLDDERRELMRASGLKNPEAFIAYQKAIELFDRGHGTSDIAAALIPANEWLERTLDLAPDFANAYLMHSDRLAHILIDESLRDPMGDEQRDDVLRVFSRDIENAIRFAPDEASRLAATYDQQFVNGNWQNLGVILDEIVQLEPCVIPQWYDVPTMMIGRADDILTLSTKGTQCNPLGFHAWASSSWSYLWMGRPTEAAEIAERALQFVEHDLIASALVSAYLAQERFDEAALVADTRIRDQERLGRAKYYIELARGSFATTDEAVAAIPESEYLSVDDVIAIAFARSGARDKASEIAAQIDARPLGYLTLVLLANGCRCGEPWDMEKTPNFARLLDDANMHWPPASLVNWPLKDW